ncbi:pentapeptide repeat-containing protein [Metabacillus sp. B2-18]|uniref:pentapeptide repeat-containing protein n=1 Tax=Metabacillus sp. B2-18 TaxID=2897333 RepID=UPI001E598106|nr:pentapeptide repeat-containing protein [Metabacillus sp. B2-18]UGB28897.1 pentapeptide repeat-containing protein [Metabacillus sp. B2-18]
MSLNVQKLDLQKADISGSKWQEVNAEELEIDNVSLAKSKVNNANMLLNDVNLEKVEISNTNLSWAQIKHANISHAIIEHIHLFGTEFRNAVLPGEGDPYFNENGEYKRISFHHCDLAKGQIKNCNLSNMEIIDCDISGLKINGILIEDLIMKLEK